jgi:putative ABC transport system permease protein
VAAEEGGGIRVSDIGVSLFLASRSIRRGNRGTFVLTVMIIALVFVNLVFLPSIISGVVEIFNRQSIDYTYGNLVIEPKENDLYIDDVAALKRKIDRIPGVAGSSPHIQIGATFTYRGKAIPGTVVAFTPQYEKEVTALHTAVTSGDFLSDGDRDQIVLGVLLAGEEDESKDRIESLGGVKVGDSVLVTFTNGETRDMRVKGIIETMAVQADRQAYVTTGEMEDVLGISDQANQILVRTVEEGNEEEMKVALMSFGVQETIKTYEEKAQGFVTDAIQSFDIINAISTLVSLVIAVVVVFIVIFISTVGKRKQIGILKAIGIDERIIINSYVIQVAVIASLGTAVGLVFTALLTLYLTANPLIFPGGAVSPVLEAGQISRSIAGLFAVSLVSGYIPAWKTAQEPILDAVRG